MLVVIPNDILEANIVFNNLTDSNTEWDNTQNVVTGDRRKVTTSGGSNAATNTESVYEALQASGPAGAGAKDPTDQVSNSSYWLYVSKVNEWKPFDESISDQAERSDNITITANPMALTNIIGVENVDAETVSFKGVATGIINPNLALWTQEFDNAYWTKTRCSITVDEGFTHNSARFADKVVEDSSNNTHPVLRSYSFTSGTVYSLSVYAEADERDGLILALPDDAFPANSWGKFDLLDGIVDSSGAGITSSSIEDLGEGRYRCSITATADATIAGSYWFAPTDSLFNQSYLGDGSSGLFAWGIQIEEGALSAYQGVEASGETIVFESGYSTIDNTGIADYWEYFFTPITRLTEVKETAIPAFSDIDLTISIDDRGGTPKVGEIIIGSQNKIGDAVHGTDLTIFDFSTKEQDIFGNYSVVERDYAKRIEFSVVIPTKSVGSVFQLLAVNRAKPLLWVGTDDGDTSHGANVYGFFSDLNIILSNPTNSDAVIKVEGLT